MQFKEIIGHTSIKEQLVNMAKSNKVSHSLLFTGPEGNGKLAMAIAFAQYLNCKNPIDNDSCGTCSSCVKYSKLIHQDLHFIFPVININSSGKSTISATFMKEWREQVIESPYFDLSDWLGKIRKDGENKQPQIFASESEEIIKRLSLKNYEGKYKVVIIWLPELMKIEAANKILKILEEPYSNTLFIMVSNTPDVILQTVLSRTQQVKLPGFDKEILTDYFINKLGVEKIKVDDIVKLSQGNIIKANKLLDSSEDLQFYFDNFVTIMRLAYSRKVGEMRKWVEDISRIPRDKQRSFLAFSTNMIRQNYIMNFNKPELVYLTTEQLAWSKKFSPFINDLNAMRIAEDFTLADIHLKQNGNSKIIFFDLSLKLIIALKEGN